MSSSEASSSSASSEARRRRRGRRRKKRLKQEEEEEEDARRGKLGDAAWIESLGTVVEEIIRVFIIEDWLVPLLIQEAYDAAIAAKNRHQDIFDQLVSDEGAERIREREFDELY